MVDEGRREKPRPTREIRIGKRAWSRLAGIFRFRGSFRRAGGGGPSNRARERRDEGPIRKYVATAPHVARNLGRTTVTAAAASAGDI